MLDLSAVGEQLKYQFIHAILLEFQKLIEINLKLFVYEFYVRPKIIKHITYVQYQDDILAALHESYISKMDVDVDLMDVDPSCTNFMDIDLDNDDSMDLTTT